MIYYSNNLYDKIIKDIPKIIINSNYKIVGSFANNEIKYVTDVDISNYLNNKINFNNEIKKIIDKLPSHIYFLNFTSGFNVEFVFPWDIIDEDTVSNYNYINSINFINNLFFNKYINESERDFCNNLLDDTPIVNNLLLIEDKLYWKSKIKWNQYEINKEKKKIINNVQHDLNEEFMINKNNIIHYIFKFGNDFIPIDVALIKNYDRQNSSIKNKNQNTFDKKNYLMFLKKEYYFILASMRKYQDKSNLKNINFILNIKYGSYRQILMDIFYLIQFIYFPIFDINEYYNLCNLVILKIKKYSEFNNASLDKIEKLLSQNININSDEWYNSLKNLEDQINLFLNEQLKSTTYYYYSLIFKNQRMKYDYLAFDIRLFTN